MTAARKIVVPFEAPANDPPRYLTLQALAAQRGLKNVRSARAWCARHGVPVRRDGRYNWVDANHVDAAIARMPATTVGQTAPPSPAVGSWVSQLTGAR